jgi:hypothetical protein
MGESQELVTGFAVITKQPPQGAGDGFGVLLFHPAHHHTEMVRFDNDTDTGRVENIHQGIGNLVS